MMTDSNSNLSFQFLKGADDVVKPSDMQSFDWRKSAAKVREHLTDAMNAKNVAFLLGSGCSSFARDSTEYGIPTMAPLATDFLKLDAKTDPKCALTELERTTLKKKLGISLDSGEFAKNLERLMEVLFSVQFLVNRSESALLKGCSETVESTIQKVSRFILRKCVTGKFSSGDDRVLSLYQAFYRKLVYRDRSLPKPWIFTTNYDQFNETAMDRLGIPYSNGFSGTVERRFNPATYRYALSEQLDVSNRKWTSVDNYIYLCKLHGSVGWVEDGVGLFPIRELDPASMDDDARVMIYPTPTKQSASFGYPYADLFREFQGRIVREQSVLFALGYSFGDDHINNIIFQALTVPSFRLIALHSPTMSPVAQKLKDLCDPRIWFIGGNGIDANRKAHYFDTFVESFMPEPPGDKVDVAVERVLAELLSRVDAKGLSGVDTNVSPGAEDDF